jgi:Bacteriophage head to tail connecting protein
MKLTEAARSSLDGALAALRQERLPWWHVWRELAEYYIPKRYLWLTSANERKNYVGKNSTILDGTGTRAGRVLAAGMMNGITSPSSPWVRLRIPGLDDDLDHDAMIWLDETTRRMLQVLSESNFYNTMAVLYTDLVFFSTGAMLIYEDSESVIRCYNSALGEYYLGQDDRLFVNRYAREFIYTVEQVVSRWGIDNVCESTANKFNRGGAARLDNVTICHMIEPHNDRKIPLSRDFKYREIYWEKAATEKNYVLAVTGYYELPGVFPRWELTGNDAYGTGPGMDALGDVIQLQHETRRKAQALDYIVRPPLQIDASLQSRPPSILPGSTHSVPGQSQVGIKPIFQVAPPLGEISQDLRDIQLRIQNTFHNDLFQMISQLETVRSATEIDARREEKLIQLGPVLERFHNECLGPALRRVFAIMGRQGLLPEAPESIADMDIEIQFVSILAAAQTAVRVAPTERLLQLVGNMAEVFPGITDIPDEDELIRDYARDIGVKAKGLRSRDAVNSKREAAQQAAQGQEAAAVMQPAAQSAKLLSETDVGGGANALAAMMGGG